MPESFLKKMLSIKPKPRIAVAGVGGCGCRAVQILASSWSWLHGVDFVNADTDFQELVRSPAGTHVWLGERLTRGLGADGSPELGRRAALESLGSIRDALQGADVVFVVCGMGGGYSGTRNFDKSGVACYAPPACIRLPQQPQHGGLPCPENVELLRRASKATSS